MDQISRIKALVTPILDEVSITLYDVSWQQEGKMNILQIAIMKADGSMDIDTCSEVSHRISEALDENDFITYEYYLEVCSPGAERELRSISEIKDAIGEFVYVKLKNPFAGVDEVKGYLKSCEESSIHMEYLAKAVKKKIDIEHDNIALITLSVKI